MAHIERLLDAGLAAEHIGVITPYNGQVAALRELRGDRMSAVEISSVDGFQGREAEALHMLTTRQHMGVLSIVSACVCIDKECRFSVSVHPLLGLPLLSSK